MNNEFFDLGYVKNLIIKNRIIIIVTIAICLCFGILFSINNSFIYQAETSLIFGRIKPQEHAISSIVENEAVNNNAEEPTQPNVENQEVITEEDNTNTTLSPEQNISLTNVNIDYNTLKTCQALIKSDNLIDKLKNELGIDDSTSSLKNSIFITKLQTSNVLVIKTNNKNGDRACDITNKIAQLFANEAKNIYNLDNVYIIDAADYNDVTRTGLNIGFILVGLLVGIVLSCAIVVARQFNYVNNAINRLSRFCKEKYSAIVRFVNSKVHKVEIRELPSGEELDENYKVVSNVSIIDSDLVSPEQPKIDNIISTDIEEFNSKTDYYDESLNSIPIKNESEKVVSEKTVSDKAEKSELKKKQDTLTKEENDKVIVDKKDAEVKDDILAKIKNKYKKVEKNDDSVQQVENDDKKNIKKIGKEEAMSIKAQEELIALREENNQKIRQDRDRIDDQAHIQKRLNEEIEARKKLELELENQKKALEEERRTMEERIMKELQKQIQDEQRKAQEEEERLAYEIEMREQEEEQRIMEEERLKMLREKEERKEQLRQERIEKRIIKDEIRKKKQEERAKQRLIQSEERARKQAIRKEEKENRRIQREAERQEILRKYYEDRNNKEIQNTQNLNINEDMNYITNNEKVSQNEEEAHNYSTFEKVKEKQIKRKELSEDFIQDNLYPKFKI